MMNPDQLTLEDVAPLLGKLMLENLLLAKQLAQVQAAAAGGNRRADANLPAEKPKTTAGAD